MVKIVWKLMVFVCQSLVENEIFRNLVMLKVGCEKECDFKILGDGVVGFVLQNLGFGLEF